MIEVSSFLWLRAYSESRNASSALNWISTFLICFCLIWLFHFKSYIVIFVVCVCVFSKLKLDVIVRVFFPAIGGIVVTFFIIWSRSKKIAISCSAFAKPFQDVISTSTLSESILHVGWYIYWILHVKICITCRSTRKPYITPRATGPRGDTDFDI